ncbi:hypothetical protein As57867_004988, partial [Aphanomyces stellatus]
CTQYCWVDLQRQFEVAHTAGRQQRCADRYSANGAVYMETMLRNQDWDDFIANYGGDGGIFTISVQAWLEQVPSGQLWLAATASARRTTTVPQEIAYWRTQNITSYKLQWQNRIQGGLSETIIVENAFGIEEGVTVKSLPQTMEAWTSYAMYWFPVDDFTVLQSMNMSLIRSADNAFVQLSPIAFEDLLGLQDADGDYIRQIQSFRDAVGPFNSIDTFYVPVPMALIELYDTFMHAMHPEVRGVVDALDSIVLTPPLWSNPSLMFYGGNPTCVFGQPQPYAQQSFNFYDACATQAPLTAQLTPFSSVFSVMTTGTAFSVSALCNNSSSDDTSCDHLHRIVEVADKLTSVSSVLSVEPAARAISALNIGTMQFASNIDGTNWTLLFAPLLDNDPKRAFYGWSCLFDWVEGRREAVSFEGDAASLVLMSSAEPPRLFPSSTNQPTSASQFIYYFVVYVTLVMALVALACLTCAIHVRCQVHGVNLFWFNRVVGSMWVGRPLMFVRGVTAIILLSTSQLQPIVQGSSSHFQLVTRTWPTTMIVCGEATWVLYVVHDVLTIASGSMTLQYGPLSCVVAWAVLVTLDSLAPVQPLATLHRKCSSLNMDQSVKCASGSLRLGSYDRFCVVFGIEAICFAIAFALVWMYRKLDRFSVYATGDRPVLGVADAFFGSGKATTDHDGSIDWVSCIMAGLVPLPWKRKLYMLDIKLWSISVTKLSKETRGKTFIHRQNTWACQASNHRVSVKGSKELPPIVGAMLSMVFTASGVVYALVALLGSVSYLQVSQVNLANDLFWASFNITGAHAFVANWLNRQLVLSAPNATLQLSANWVNLDGTFDSTSASVASAANFGALVQHTDLNTVDTAIAGLRSTDGCNAPWIFSQYCFVDFERRWELANSDLRQSRCKAMTANGALFLES